MGFVNTKKKFLISSLVEKRRVTVSSHMNVESRLQHVNYRDDERRGLDVGVTPATFP